MAPTASHSFRERRSRLEHSLSKGLDKRLASYAAAASAAGVGRWGRAPEVAELITRAASAVGVGFLLTAGPASARIVYTPAYAPIGFSTSFALDLNHDGITDFKFYAIGPTFSWLKVYSWQAGNAVVGQTQGASSGYGAPFTCRGASALPAGHRIGPGSRFGAYRTMFLKISTAPASGPGFFVKCGSWENAQGRFLGLEFMVQGQKHFGWARLNRTGPRNNTRLTGYAYEIEPNKPIRAGDTGPVADARLPEMHGAPPTIATLGLLALGSAGLDIWRKEHSVAFGESHRNGGSELAGPPQ